MARRTKKSDSVATVDPETNGNPEPRRLILLEIDPFNPPFPECHVEYRQADDECDEPHYVVTECVAGRRGNYPGLAGGEPIDVETTAPELANGEPIDVETTVDEAPSLEQELATLRAKVAQADEDAERRRKSLAEVVRLQAAAEDASDKAKRAKKAYEAAVDAHFELEAQLDSPQQRLPFPPDEDTSPGKPVRVDEAPEDESWRTVRLWQMGVPDELPGVIVARLADANIATVGDLSDYLKPNPSGFVRKLTDVLGIGQAKAERIEQALDQFWAMRSEFAPATVAADEPDEDEDLGAGRWPDDVAEDFPGDDGAEGGAA